MTASLVSRIDAFLRKAVRFGYTSQIQQLADLLSDADEQLFTKMGASNHCLYQLLPPIKSIPMQLRDSQCLYMSFQSVTITYTNVLLFYVISFSVLIDCLLIYCVVFIVFYCVAYSLFFFL